MADFMKDFKVGDKVKVVYGKYLGKTGVITDRSVANGEYRKMFRIGGLWHPLSNLELITDADIQAAHDDDMGAAKAAFAGNLGNKIATLEYDLKLADELHERQEAVIATLTRERDAAVARFEGGFAEYQDVLKQLQAVTKERDALRAFYNMARNMDFTSDMWDAASAEGGNVFIECVTIAHDLSELGIPTDDPNEKAMNWETPDTVGITDVLQSRPPQAGEHLNTIEDVEASLDTMWGEQ